MSRGEAYLDHLKDAWPSRRAVDFVHRRSLSEMSPRRSAIVAAVLFLVRAGVSGLQPVSSSPGTIEHLEEIFVGRCWDLQHVKRADRFAGREKDCAALWRDFSSAFAYKDPCDTTADDYGMFAESAAHELIPDKTLFWENVYPFVEELSSGGKRYETISDTLLGYMANDIQWCGQPDPPGINYDNCPTWSECEAVNGQQTNTSYWKKASQYFSFRASGKTYVLMNGSHPFPFDPESMFATHELVNLTPEHNVTRLHIMVLHDLGGPVVENCGEGSLLDLEHQGQSQGLIVSCEDDPSSVRFLQCVDMPSAGECVKLSTSIRGSVSTSGRSRIVRLLFASCIFLTMRMCIP